MTLSAPQPLDAHHPVHTFDCGKPALTDWLLRHARHAQGSVSARTFGCRIAGYYSLTVGQIDTLEAPDWMRRRGVGQYPTPVVIPSTSRPARFTAASASRPLYKTSAS